MAWQRMGTKPSPESMVSRFTGAFMRYRVSGSSVRFLFELTWCRHAAYQYHGGTTEEGNCSYLLPLSHRELMAADVGHSTSGRHQQPPYPRHYIYNNVVNISYHIVSHDHIIWSNHGHIIWSYLYHIIPYPGLTLGLPPANERRRYKITSLIGWAQT